MSKRRVVVTGVGMLSPLGLNVEDSWQGIVQGKSGATRIDRFDPTDYKTQICASVKNFEFEGYLDRKEARKLDEFVQFAVVAAGQAIKDAGLTKDEPEADRIGVAIGSGIGGLPFIEKYTMVLNESGPRRVSPFFIPGAIVNMAPGYVSMQYGFKGPNTSIVTACTTGAHNIGMAARSIAYGDADVMVTGGAEMATIPLGIAGFSAARALSVRNDEPEKASRPWDKDRDGFVLGDGAGVLILEEYERAKSRGAKIYAEVKGFGMSADAYHMTSPDPDGSGFVRCMTNALNDAGLNADQLQYVNAHGTSTPTGDIIEANAVEQVFGKDIACSSTKSMTGHLLGAAGAVEAIFSILALRDQVAPPTINLDNPDDGCNLNFVPHQAQEMMLENVLSNSFGFGGTNASVIFSKI